MRRSALLTLLLLAAGAVALSWRGRGAEAPALDPALAQELAAYARDRPAIERRVAEWLGERRPPAAIASVDGERPLIGAYFYFVGDEQDNLRRLIAARDGYDFLQLDPREKDIARLERVGIPWIGVPQLPVPLGRRHGDWKMVRGLVERLTKMGRQSRYCLGWNDGSEPHISFESLGYTGHNADQIAKLGVAEPTRDEFLAWLKTRYGDRSPADDTNRDGITFNRDFGLGFGDWQEVAQPANRDTPWFKYALAEFECKLIHDVPATRMTLFHRADPTRNASPRLLCTLHDPRMAVKLDYLNLGDTVGVTFYTGWGIYRPDPNQSGFEFKNALLSRGKRKVNGWSVKLPTVPGPGIAFAQARVHLPRAKQLALEFEIKGEHAEYRVNLVAPQSKVLTQGACPAEHRRFRDDLGRWASREVILLFELQPSNPADPGGGSCEWADPKIVADGRVWLHLTDLARELRVGYRYLGSSPSQAVITNIRGTLFNAEYCHAKLSWIANHARLAGKRVCFNEHHPTSGSPSGVSRTWLFLSLARMMQFEPALICYFCESVENGPFPNYDVGWIRDDLAELRNQSALWNLYPQIKRRSDTACFLPSFLPTPELYRSVGLRLGANSELIRAMGALGADCYLLNDLEQAARYRNVILVMGFADGATERKLADFLRQGRRGKRVLILAASPYLYAPIGRRLSARIEGALTGILPAAPAGGEMSRSAVVLLGGLRCEISAPAQVELAKMPSFRPIRSTDGRIVGAADGSLLCLAGWPETKLQALIERYFKQRPGRIDAGGLQILTSAGQADRPGLYSLERHVELKLRPGLVGYDVVRREPVSSSTWGPTLMRVWRSDDSPQVVDTGALFPEQVSLRAGHADLRLFVPRAHPRGDVVFYSRKRPRVLLDGSIALEPRAIGGDLWRCAVNRPAQHWLSIRSR